MYVSATAMRLSRGRSTPTSLAIGAFSLLLMHGVWVQNQSCPPRQVFGLVSEGVVLALARGRVLHICQVFGLSPRKPALRRQGI